MSQPLISIVIPAFNEENNIEPLVVRIDNSCKKAKLSYEIIFVNDHSTDNTKVIIQRLAKTYPIKIIDNLGNSGKAESLLIGFSKVNNGIIAMIDADLQYPPEAIPSMVKKLIHDQVDIVIAERKERNTTILRSIISKSYRIFFVKKLLNISFDAQSGLKVFRKSVLEHIKPQGKGWKFDLDFLYRAKNAGYILTSHPILFEKRFSGKPKINILKASISMAIDAILIKLLGNHIIPFHPEKQKKYGKGFTHKGKEYIHHTELDFTESAFLRLTFNQGVILIGLILLLTIGFIISWHSTLVILIAVLTFFYFADVLFQAFLVSRSFSTQHEYHIKDQEIISQPDNIWPTYTIFCPLYKEWRVLPQFIRAMSQMNYPKDKLQVLLLLEEDDSESIENIKKMTIPKYMEVLLVPDSKPKTKPKALNYGLSRAKGTYAVIYDAEDIPDPLQLKKSVITFNKVSSDVVCLQAKLNFYNPQQNIITRMFTAEYSLWFDLILPGLQSIGAPIPLGGTSNHFRVSDLHDLKGWDAFNVTEDCDLGMRLSKRKLKTAVIDSTTMEEATSKAWNWYGQRSRWIKGYIQTYLVHVRDSHKFTSTVTQPDGILFHLIVGGKVLSMLINPFMWLITISYFAFRSVIGPTIESFYPGPVLYLGVFSLVFGNFMYMYIYMIGCVKRGYYELIKYALLTPIYWLAMSIAAWRSLFEMIYRPFYWSKTVHGFHLQHKQRIKKTHKFKKENQSDGFKHVLEQYTFTNKNNKNISHLPSYCDILQVTQ